VEPAVLGSLCDRQQPGILPVALGVVIHPSQYTDRVHSRAANQGRVALARYYAKYITTYPLEEPSLPRPKKYRPLDTATVDPMTAAILTGLKPHIDAAVRDQIATVLLEVLAKVAPERLVKSTATGPTAVVVERSTEVPSKAESEPAKGANGGRKQPPVTP
jgi:hypothetical protein